jgi:DNA polymerase-3 subunit epsilon
MIETDDMETLARRLETTGDYRVLRRLRPRDVFADAGDLPMKTAVLVDTETTGLDPAGDEIIELALLAFTYTADGRVIRVTGTLDQMQEPSGPIPPEITTLTGIDDSMVAGQAIDEAAVNALVAPAALVIAHNAGFDRRFCERRFEVFRTKAWACSQSEIDWAGEGVEGRRLGYLLNAVGLFHEGHRALEDCRALLEVLAAPLPRSRIPALAALLETARRPTVRFWAVDSPFDLKDILKARGYRWNDGGDGRPRAWWIDVPEADAVAEKRFLETEIYQHAVDLPETRITAFDRFSYRV